MYFNTTNESKENVKKFKKINKKQDTKVLNIIRNINKPFSASLVWKIYLRKHLEKKPILLTSVRRSIDTLKNINIPYIVKTGNKVMGIHGKKEFEYRLLK